MDDRELDSFDVLEPRIERLMERFHLPPGEAQTILDEVLLTMLTKRDRIRDPERWLLRTLKSRCRIYWRDRRRRLFRVVDEGLLALLDEGSSEPADRQALREDLEALLARADADSRELLQRRYGLTEEDGGTTAREAVPEADLLRALGALARSFRRGPADPPPGDDDEEILADFADLEGFG